MQQIQQLPVLRADHSPLLDTLTGMSFETRRACKDELVFAAGQRRAGVYRIFEGWACRYHDLPDGSRAITRFLMPGDFIGLQSVVKGVQGTQIRALSSCRLRLYATAEFVNAVRSSNETLLGVLRQCAEEEQAMERHMIAIGRLPGLSRVAWLAQDLLTRARAAALVERGALQTPVTQVDISDALGLSLVHTNKSIAKLQSAGILHWSRGVLKMLDETRLHQIVGLNAVELA